MKYFVAIFLLALSFNLTQTGSNENSIIGFWETSDKDTIEIVKEEGIYTGYLRGFELPQEIEKSWVLDEKNEDESLRTRQLEGIVIFENMEYNSELWEGEIYLPEEGTKMDCTLILKNEDLIELTVKVLFFSETDELKRIKKK